MTPSTRRRPAARRGEGEKLRSEILSVTERLLEESGDARTLSLRAVARETGVAATSIYLHFESLDSLVRAVKEDRYAEFCDVCRDAIQGAADDPRSRLRALADAYVAFALERPGTYKVLFSTTLRLAPSDPPEPMPGQEAQSFALQALRETRDSAEGAALALAQMWCLLHGMVTLRADHPQHPWPDRDVQIDDLVDRMLLP